VVWVWIEEKTVHNASGCILVMPSLGRPKRGRHRVMVVAPCNWRMNMGTTAMVRVYRSEMCGTGRSIGMCVVLDVAVCRCGCITDR
jgi:hypothetical protein